MNASALLATIAVDGAAIAVVTRPASAFARRYVSDLDQARVQTGAAPSRDATAKSREFRALWLLTPTSQGILTAALRAATLMRGAAAGAWGEAIVALPLVALLGMACSVDTVCHHLPSHFLAQTAMWIGTATLALSLFDATAGTPLPKASWAIFRSILCAASAGVTVGAMVLLPGSGMGLGDAKLCAVLGLWLGYFDGTYVAMGIALGFFIGGFIAAALMACHLADHKTPVALGPYLSLGAWSAWILAVAWPHGTIPRT